MKAQGTVKKDAVRAEVRALVHGPSYMTFDDVVADFPMTHINTRPPNVPYTPWHLLEHMRITQRDILEYIEDDEYRQPDWPDDYWPKPEATADAKAWQKTIAAFRRDRVALEKIAANPRVALGSALPYARKHTLIRELLIVSIAPRAFMCGSSSTSWVSRIAPQGTPALPRTASTSCLGRAPVHSRAMPLSASRCCHRVGASTQRGSASRSSRSMARAKSSHMPRFIGCT